MNERRGRQRRKHPGTRRPNDRRVIHVDRRRREGMTKPTKEDLVVVAVGKWQSHWNVGGCGFNRYMDCLYQHFPAIFRSVIAPEREQWAEEQIKWGEEVAGLRRLVGEQGEQRWRIIAMIQKLQPLGSPPTGTVETLVRWIVDEALKEQARMRREGSLIHDAIRLLHKLPDSVKTDFVLVKDALWTLEKTVAAEALNKREGGEG